MLQVRKDIKRIVYVEPFSELSIEILFNNIRKDLGLPFKTYDVEYVVGYPPERYYYGKKIV